MFSPRVLKLLSEDPGNYKDAPREGIRRILEEVTGKSHPRDMPVDTTHILSIRMGTTVATNALLERKGERCALVTTKGFKDLLHIGNQSRPFIFDLEIQIPDELYESVVEIDEQVILPLDPEPGKRSGSKPAQVQNGANENQKLVEGVTGETLAIRKAPDLKEANTLLKGLLDKGIKSIAIVFKHAAIFPDHEQAVGRVAKELGFEQVSLSSEVMQMVKMVPRGFTASADAYLTPHIMRYIHDFQSGFDEGLKDRVQLSFMQSDGGLSPVSSFSGHKAILSGPAGGYVGYAMTTQWDDKDHTQLQMIGFDMGGTSTDVSRYAGRYEHVFDSTIAGVTIQTPQLDINTVAAGGGSRLFYRMGIFSVGPESAGAHPGPVCYRKNGYPAITDANLVLGRILPEFFPAIFGETEDQLLDAEASQKALEEIAADVNAESKKTDQPEKSTDEVAMGFIKVANETMCRPIRALTQMRGFDVSQHVLASFGGAGGQHACAIARALGMRTIFVQRYSGVLSAVGIGLAEVVAEEQDPAAETLDKESLPVLEHKLEKLADTVKSGLKKQGFKEDQIECEHYLNLRYDGTDVAMMTKKSSEEETYEQAFENTYKREFGFVLESRVIMVDDVRVRGMGKAVPIPEPKRVESDPGPLPQPKTAASAYFEMGGRQKNPRLSACRSQAWAQG